MKTIHLFLFFLGFSSLVMAQGMGINDDNSTPHPSAMIDVKATNKGALFPRLTSTQINGIAAPATGLLVFNVSTNRFMYYAGTWLVLPNSQDILPVGTIISHGGNTSSMVTSGGQWKECDGSAVSRSTFSDLYSMIGISWGSGDGSSTFNLPDLRGQFLRGWASSFAQDPDGSARTASAAGGNAGYNVGSKQDGKVENHAHPFSATTSSDGSHTHAISFDDGAGGNQTLFGLTNITINDIIPSNCSTCPIANDLGYTQSNGVHTHTVNGTTNNPDAPHGGTETRPKNVYVRYYIKVSN